MSSRAPRPLASLYWSPRPSATTSLAHVLCIRRHSLRDVTYYFMSLLYVLATLLTWLACMMLAIAHHEKPRSITWLASVKARPAAVR